MVRCGRKRKVAGQDVPDLEYEVKWKGYGDDDTTWEPEKHLTGSAVLAVWTKQKMAAS